MDTCSERSILTTYQSGRVPSIRGAQYEHISSTRLESVYSIAPFGSGPRPPASEKVRSSQAQRSPPLVRVLRGGLAGEARRDELQAHIVPRRFAARVAARRGLAPRLGTVASSIEKAEAGFAVHGLRL